MEIDLVTPTPDWGLGDFPVDVCECLPAMFIYLKWGSEVFSGRIRIVDVYVVFGGIKIMQICQWEMGMILSHLPFISLFICLCVLLYIMCLWFLNIPHLTTHFIKLTLRNCHLLWYSPDLINTLRPRQNCRHFPDDIFKCIFLNENV